MHTVTYLDRHGRLHESAFASLEGARVFARYLGTDSRLVSIVEWSR